MSNASVELSFEPTDNLRLGALSGQYDEHLKLIEQRLNVSISQRADKFVIKGSQKLCDATRRILEQCYQMTAQPQGLSAADVHVIIQTTLADLTSASPKEPSTSDPVITTKRGYIRPKGRNQKLYVEHIQSHDVSFGIGPAGTGKTYLAVAAAVDALEKQEVRRIILTRPAVEAGERLGFLPGDLAQKIDPYLRPLYDALYEMLGFETVAKFMERNIIEVAPLAYMRGRTLNESFIILDESQNTTSEQMKMFLTRIGFRSKAVITGDITQIDLPGGTRSGLKHAVEVLQDLDALSFTFFGAKDVVRHHVVQQIVEAYERFESR